MPRGAAAFAGVRSVDKEALVENVDGAGDSVTMNVTVDCVN